MNTDFTPPQTSKCLLYPSEYRYVPVSYCALSNLKGDSKQVISQLRDEIAAVFDIGDSSQIYLFDSASSAIIALLATLKAFSKIKKVYVPSFSCTELADSVISAGLALCVYDITDDFRPSHDFVRSLFNEEEAVLILPALFGSRPVEAELMNLIDQLIMPVIFDEAQSFPMPPQYRGTALNSYFSVISFGKSKPLSSIGGGALIVHRPDSNVMFKEFEPEEGDIRQGDWLPHLASAVRRQLSRYAWGRKAIGFQYRYTNLEALHSAQQFHVREPQWITLLQARMALMRLRTFQAYKQRQDMHVARLLNTLERTFGKPSLQFVLKRDRQCLLPIRVPDHKRKAIGIYLGQRGAQTTFYYYPLHKMERYRQLFQLQECGNSERIFGEILLLPVHADSSPRHINKLERIIRQFYEHTTDT